MKNKLITPIIALLLLSTLHLTAQVDRKTNISAIDSIKIADTVREIKPKRLPNDRHVMYGASRSRIMTAHPLYVLKNNNRILENGVNWLNPTSIKSINVLKDASAVNNYGEKARNGVVEITVDEDSILLSVEKIVSVYNLPKKSEKYPVYINEKYCAKDAIMLERRKIKTVRVVTRLMSGINEKQLEITTVEKQ